MKHPVEMPWHFTDSVLLDYIFSISGKVLLNKLSSIGFLL